MSASPQIAQRRGGDMWRMLRTLAGVSLLSGMLIVLAYETTLPRILANRQRAIEEAVFRVLPGATAKVTYAVEGESLRRAQEGHAGGEKIYAGYDNTGRLVGVAIEGAGQGYQDVIRVLFGYSPDTQCATGFTVIESKETPGLGDKIGFDPAFLANFDGLPLTVNDDVSGLQHDVVGVKHGAKKSAWEIDGVSGATISTRAVGRIVTDSAGRIVPIVLKQVDQIRARE
ncbi:MAG: FMN-binding protein [Candidatus Hydrogenedentes bacterium]|nr:FMN-binding protein [Candidatus Hydrogenedentota bacterium]